MIVDNPSDWVRTVLWIGEPREIVELESIFLDTLDAAKDARSFNLRNTQPQFGTTGMSCNKGIPKSNETKMKMKKPKSEATKEKMRVAALARTKEHYLKVSNSLTGKKHTESRKENQTIGQLNRWKKYKSQEATK